MVKKRIHIAEVTKSELVCFLREKKGAIGFMLIALFNVVLVIKK